MKKSRQFIVNLLVLLLMILNPLSSFSDMAVQAQIHEVQEDYITTEEVGQLTDTVSDPRIEETPDFSLYSIETEDPGTEPVIEESLEEIPDPMEIINPLVNEPDSEETPELDPGFIEEPIEEPIEDPIEEPIEDPIEPSLSGSVTVSITWQGGLVPRPVFWLKLQKLDFLGNVMDVPGVPLIQANMAYQVNWANIADFDKDAQYTVSIVDEQGQPYAIPGYSTVINGLSVISTWLEQATVDVSAKVEWLYSLDPRELIDWSKLEDFQQPTVWLRLYRQSSENETPIMLLTTELKKLTVGITEVTWAGMPRSTASGMDYIYSVKQVDAEGRDYTPEFFQKAEAGLLVQNVVIPGSGGPGTRDIIDPPVPTHTYIFTVDGVEVERQIVKDGEYLVEPEAPVKEHYKFTGWFVGDEQIDFTQPIVVGGTSQEITAIARFEEVYYVFFMDTTGDEPRVFVTKEGITGDTVSTTDVKLPLSSAEGVTGWYKDQALTDGPVGDDFTIGTTNQQLWPKIEEGHFLYFESGENASYIEPQFVPANGETVEPTPPTRPGYTFSHWSETEGGAAYSFGQGLTDDLTLYAVWTPNANTPYTVIFWKQSVHDDKNAADDDKTYDYAESAQRTAATGTTVSPTNADKTKNYQGFHYNDGKSVDVVVKGDGTTVLNVYYDRNLLTIDFHRASQPGAEDGEYTGLYGQTLAQNGYIWPSNYRWVNQSGTNTLTFLDAFIFDNLPAYGSTTYINVYARSLSGSAQIVHYKEALDGTWVEANRIRTGGGTFGFSNKYTGFTVYQYRADGGQWRSASPGGSASYNTLLEIRHKRNSYNLAFYNYNTTVRTESKLYEAPLGEFAGYTPPRPTGLPEVYTFKGWYKDEAFTVPFNFNTETMPANDLMVYAKWAPPEFIGTVHLVIEGSSEPLVLQIPYNETIDPATMPTVQDHLGNVILPGDDDYIVTVPENHRWIGWATKDGDTFITFNFNTRILSDITLYPYYVDNEVLTVTYDAGEGSGTVPVDSKKYAFGSYADVLPPTGLTAPEGKVFLGWLSGDTLYQPGDKIQITGNMTLIAQWGILTPTTTITYLPNYPVQCPPIPEPITISLPNNGTHELYAASTFAAPPGYVFSHWSYVDKHGVPKTGAPGDEIMADINPNHPNEIKAEWTPITISVQGSKTWNDANDQDGLRPESITIRLLADGTEIDHEVVTGDGWAWSFDNLPTHDNCQEIVYSITEDAIAEYTTEYDGYNVTNIHTPETVDITGSKTWNDYDNVYLTRPEKITIHLWADGTEVDHKEVTAAEDWSWTFTGRPKYRDGGIEIIYTITETEIPGYTTVITGYNVTNTLVVINHTATKTWVGGPIADHTAVDLILKRISAKPGSVEEVVNVDEVTGGSDPTFTYTWNNLPKYDQEGFEYTYSVEEPGVVDGKVIINGNTYEVTQEGNAITNTYVIPNDGEFTATKVWSGDENVTRPTMTFTLWRKIGTTIDEAVPGAEVKEVDGTTTTATWTGLETTDSNGNPYTFYVKEAFKTPGDPGNDNWELGEFDFDTNSITNTVASCNGKLTVTKVLENELPAAPAGLLGLPLEFGFSVNGPYGFIETFTLKAGESKEFTGLYCGEYTVEETETHGYTVSYDPGQTVTLTKTANEQTVTVTNTVNASVLIVKTVTKVWVDGPKPDVVVELWRKGYSSNDSALTEPDIDEKVGEFTATDTVLSHDFTDLAKHDPSGREFEYYVKEPTVPTNYTATFDQDTLTVTNKYVQPTEDLTATKTWMPEGLLDSMKFEVSYQLYRTTAVNPTPEAVGEPVTLNAPDWAYTWADMPTTDPVGNPYTYYVIELTDLPAGFSKEEEGMNVTNTYDNEDDDVVEDLTATKTWMPEGLDPDLKVPVWFQLWRYTRDDPAAAVEVGDPVQITGPDWTYTWADMPETDPNGYEYTYFVTEVDEDGDDWVPDGFTKEEGGMTVTNTYVIPKTDVTAKKVWVNGPTPRPTVWFKLYRQIDGGPIEEVPGAEIKALPDGTTSVTWTDIDKTDNNGNEYTFFVKEVDAGGNDFTPPNYSKVEDGLTVTNTYVIPKTDVTAMKIWEGGSTPRPTVWFKLYRQISGGAVEAVPGAEIKALPDGTTSVTWTGVEKTDINGNEYIFSVKEVNAAGDDFTPENYVKTEAGLVVTNKFVSPKIDVTATKIWKGGSGPRPTIQIQLYRNGVAFGSPVTLVHPTTTYTWTDLDEFDFNGNAYTYTVDEVAIPSGYSKSVVGLTITNTFIEGPEPPEVPYTGDANNALLYGVLAISSLLGFGAVVAGKRRKKE